MWRRTTSSRSPGTASSSAWWCSRPTTPAGSAGPSDSGLGPRQAGLAPAADAVPVLRVVLVALEALEHVVGLAPARAHRRLRRAVRARARAADEHHRLVLLGERGQLADELRIGAAARIGLPLDRDRPGERPHVEELRLGTHVEQLRGRLPQPL